MRNQISFMLIESKHLMLLSEWFKAPHVNEFWKETTDISELKTKFIVKHPKCGVDSYIIFYNDDPIGYIQSYQATKSGNGWWADAEPGTYGIDLFIGIEQMIGKGIGTQIMKEFIRKLCQNSDVKKVIVDPTPENSRMIHICEKIGFSNKGRIDTPDGEAILLVLEI